MNNPEGYVLVQVKQLAQWREWANNVAAWSTKSDRSSEVARLKASISGAMVSATQPTASNAGEREIHSNRDAYNAGYEDALQTAGVSVLVGHHHTPAALATQPQTGLPDYYISGPYTVGKWAGWHSVCETATARVVHHFKPDQPQEVQKPVGIPLNADGHPQVAPTIEAMDALALKAGIPPYSHLQKVLDRKKSQREQVAYLSWGGFNLTGDHKSIDEAKRLLHEASIVPELRELLARALAPQPEQVAQDRELTDAEIAAACVDIALADHDKQTDYDLAIARAVLCAARASGKGGEG